MFSLFRGKWLSYGDRPEARACKQYPPLGVMELNYAIPGFPWRLRSPSSILSVCHELK
ncbi:MAG: hypothetical protein ACJZ72_01915 [Opitutales bacterium]